jgi:hypothetical protein
VVPTAILAHPCHYCHRPLDPYGDHLFQCSYNKKILSDNIRDTIYTVCHTLAPLAGFTHSCHSVTRETSNLLPAFPTKRPADVGIRLRPSALSSTPKTPIDFLAIDITVTKTPDAMTAVEPASNNPVTKAHLFSLRRKLSHSADVNNSTYFQALLDNNIALMPFTVDPFGGIGYFAHRFLYGTSTTLPHKPPEPPPPNWRSTLSLPHMIALYDQLPSLPTGLLPKATKAYTPPPTALNTTPISPLSWAHQCMALNFSTHIAQHLLRSIANASRSLHHKDIPTLGTLGLPFPQRIITAFLDPLPHYLMQAG